MIDAASNGEPAGFVLAYILERIDRVEPMICLYEIGVSGAHRRRGIGRAMIDLLKALGAEIGALKIWTIADRSNEAAVRLYESTGAVADSGGGGMAFIWSAGSLRESPTSRGTRGD